MLQKKNSTLVCTIIQDLTTTEFNFSLARVNLTHESARDGFKSSRICNKLTGGRFVSFEICGNKTNANETATMTQSLVLQIVKKL